MSWRTVQKAVEKSNAIPKGEPLAREHRLVVAHDPVVAQRRTQARREQVAELVALGQHWGGRLDLMLEQFGGPQGELAAACRYFTQYLAEEDPGRKDMLIDIATEELSHLEVIGTIVAMLNRGAKARLSEAMESEAELYKSIAGGGNDSHVTQVLYGGGPALTNSAGVPWSAAYVDSIGDPTCDLRSKATLIKSALPG